MQQSRSRRILVIGSLARNHKKIFLSQRRRLSKGLIRLGHDVAAFDYRSALLETSPIKNKVISKRLYKPRVDQLLTEYVRSYEPHIIIVGFPKEFGLDSVDHLRRAAPAATLLGIDDDPWPDRHSNRISVGAKLDIVIATNNGEFLELYRQAGTPLCSFLPNMCDPDLEHHYPVDDTWRSDLLWTGKTGHSDTRSDPLREKIIANLIGRKSARVYGCLGRPRISGIDHLRAIAGTRIGVSINAVNNVPLYHSDRLTQYAACGAFVLAKRVPETDLLFKDRVHLRYFDSAEEFSELADWYLEHEDERRRIAAAGMERAHTEFNCQRMAGYLLDLVETGRYSAPWIA